MADNTPAPRGRRRSREIEKSSKNSEASTTILPAVTELGLEIGSDANLPYSTPYNPAANGTGKNLVEQYRDQSEEQGPSVRQLQTMRRMDGQARALYRLTTLPIRSALSSCTFVPAEGGEAEAEFIEACLLYTSPSPRDRG